jgi:hypothetical protein
VVGEAGRTRGGHKEWEGGKAKRVLTSKIWLQEARGLGVASSGNIVLSGACAHFFTRLSSI